MTTGGSTYNPGFLSDEELTASFCVRTNEFESVMESIRESTGRANQHVVVIGPRGSGKTTLLLRVAAELRSKPPLSSRLLPVVFAEESYEVNTCGEFWLEALSRLVDQAPDPSERLSLGRSVADIRQEHDDQALEDRCLGALLDYADRHEKRLVFVVENLNMMFADMRDDDAGWRLRKTLQTESRVLVLGSATSRFGEIDRPDRALYDLFRIVQLRPLDYNECAVLWERVSGKRPGFGQIRSLQILTGGNPRLLAVVARFGAEQSFQGLMSNLLDLVDDNTAYFKGHLEALPSQERRVYLALGALWRPSTAREVASRARTDTSKCSAQLGRLVRRGVVATVDDASHHKEYYLTERMYNIYYLLRNGRGKDKLVEALIAFMLDFYSLRDLAAIARKAAQGFVVADANAESANTMFLMRLLEQPVLQEHIQESTAALEQVHDRFQVARRTTTAGDYEKAHDLYIELLDYIEADPSALSHMHDVVDAVVRTEYASVLLAMQRMADALHIFEKIAKQYGHLQEDALAPTLCRASFGRALAFEFMGKVKEAVAEYDRLEERFEPLASIQAIADQLLLATIAKGDTLRQLGRTKERRATYVRAAKLATDMIEQRESADPSWKLEVLESRAYARNMAGDVEGSERDVAKALMLLPEIKPPPNASIDRMITLALLVGSERMAELIRNSPAVHMAGVLLAGLQLDMNERPRVAPEVAEVARDVKKALDLRRREPKFARWG